MNKKTLQKNVTAIYIVYILTVFVWYTHYKYFDIMQAKRAAFLLGTIVYDVIMVLTILVRKRDGAKTQWRNLLTGEKLLTLALIFVWIIGLIGCVDIRESFWGYGGKCTGLLIYILGTIALIFIGEYLEWSSWLTWIVLISAVVVCSLQVINRWGYDPFAMYDDMVEDQRRLFLSTIGQINYNASLNCMIMAIITTWFLLCKEQISKLVYGITLMIVFAGSISCCSDSVYLGILLILGIQLIYVGFHMEKWQRYVLELLILEVTIIILWFVWSFVHRVFVWDTTLLLFDFRILSRLSLILLAFIGIGSILGRLTGEKAQKVWKAFAIGIIIVIPILLFLIIQYVMTDPEYWKAISAWGGYRTEIWSRCWSLFKKSSIWHKLFGYGFNNVSQALEVYNLSEFDGTTIADAHNIVINTLITSGILGVVAWGAILIFICCQAFHLLKKQEEMLLILVGVIVYIVQGMVNGPQIFTTPLFLIEIGVFLAMLKCDKG